MRRVVALFLLVSLAVAGCTNSKPIVGGSPKPHPIEKIVSLSPSASEIISGLGVGYKIKGRTQSDNRPEQILKVPVVASVKPDYEKIQVIHPDLVVYDKALYNDTDIEKIKQLGAETYVLEANTLAGFQDEVMQLGKLLNAETEASNYADRIYQAAQVAQGDPIQPPPTVAVVMPGAGGEHMIAGTKTFQADLVKSSGGQPVGPGEDKFVPLNAEGFVKDNPDVILVAGDATEILKDPRFASIKAVKNKHTYSVDQDVLLRKTMNLPELIDQLHRLLAGRK